MPSFNALPQAIDELSAASTLANIHETCSRVCFDCDFDSFIFGARLPTSMVKPYIVIVSGYPTPWRDRYNEKSYLGIDPTVSHCASSLTPILWDQIQIGEGETSTVQQFMDEAGEFGLRSGASFPVHSPRGEFGMLSLSSPDGPSDVCLQVTQILPQLQLFTAYLHEAVRRLVADQAIPISSVQLTEREKQCLLWASEGKTSWETSKILEISERTVIFHLKNAAGKLQVVNRQQAVARAVSMGLISPQLGA